MLFGMLILIKMLFVLLYTCT